MTIEQAATQLSEDVSYHLLFLSKGGIIEGSLGFALVPVLVLLASALHGLQAQGNLADLILRQSQVHILLEGCASWQGE